MSEGKWTSEQLKKFTVADDFRVSPFYDDGKTYGTPTWIWSVVVDDQLFIRAWNGKHSRWHRSAIRQKAGRIFLAGNNYEVIFEPLLDEEINKKVDSAYQKKYANSSYMKSMIQPGPRGSTLRVIPKIEN